MYTKNHKKYLNHNIVCKTYPPRIREVDNGPGENNVPLQAGSCPLPCLLEVGYRTWIVSVVCKTSAVNACHFWPKCTSSTHPPPYYANIHTFSRNPISQMDGKTHSVCKEFSHPE